MKKQRVTEETVATVLERRGHRGGRAAAEQEIVVRYEKNAWKFFVLAQQK